MTQAIKSVINEYLKQSNTDYALLLEGAWGCGKTYFVKNELAEYVGSIKIPNIELNMMQKAKSFLISSNNGSIYYKLSYISLNGLSSIQDFHARVISTVMPGKIGNTLSSAMSMGLSWLESNLFKFDIKMLENIAPIRGRLLVFDDFERIGTNVTTKEILGAIL